MCKFETVFDEKTKQQKKIYIYKVYHIGVHIAQINSNVQHQLAEILWCGKVLFVVLDCRIMLIQNAFIIVIGDAYLCHGSLEPSVQQKEAR